MNTLHKRIELLKSQLKLSILGQDELVDALLVALFADGHILLEGLPGTAKTRAVKTLAQLLELDFDRVQFTPDLLPSDVIGYERLDQGALSFKEGPIFTNIMLADEINRAPPKVQSALLEAMEERQVTSGNKTRPLSDIFMVMATQNPIEQEGTYPLPEAQMDRFLVKVSIEYPDSDTELRILKLVHKEEQNDTEPIKISDATDLIREVRQSVHTIHTAPEIEQYIVDLVMQTRQPKPDSNLSKWLKIGASPRATIALHKAARALAVIEGKTFVSPDEVRKVAPWVLGHRFHLSYEAFAEQITPTVVVNEILKETLIP